MAAPARAVLFDLDGTLVQTRVASWEVFRTISDDLGLGISAPEEYFALFDGNVYSSLRAVCRDDAQAAEVKRLLLERMREHYYPRVVPGMAAVARRLAASATLAVVSSNATAVVRRVLADHGLNFCFSHVFGGDVVESKQEAIRQLLAEDVTVGRRCEGPYDEGGPQEHLTPEGMVLVTDTVGDVREARAAGIRAVGVTWGMHRAEELQEAGAEFVAYWPQEITAHLCDTSAAPRGACALTATCSGFRPQQPAPGSDHTGCRCGGACSGKTSTPDATSPVDAVAAAKAASAVRRARRVRLEAVETPRQRAVPAPEPVDPRHGAVAAQIRSALHVVLG
ncbi:HAD family hydrolase [Ornithinicoccus hortensis]|uniref:Phosphoglycolate phosphatase n=1 Tax=Ornithinicoccus hortensis TaxID=82346 RepID=A0A542YTC1_9MICO|nr:HAD family hydrolase [Ornithinicoccus hortensis]TQL51345.1 phosphoglycolate phosphatase [Ornithinicoccus hortensis]